MDRHRSPAAVRGSPKRPRNPRAGALPSITKGCFMDSAIAQKAYGQKAYKGLGMEGFTAKWYAALTRKSLRDFKTLARRVADDLPPGSRVLEVAPGPGYFAIELAKLGTATAGGYRITGLDISRTFVEIARRNALEARIAANFRIGNAA